MSTDGNALTDHTGETCNDGLFAVAIEGPERGKVKQFLSVPTGAEQASADVTDDNRTIFVSIQHPGEITDASVDNPASAWPDGDFARPAVIVTWRLDGREIGDLRKSRQATDGSAGPLADSNQTDSHTGPDRPRAPSRLSTAAYARCCASPQQDASPAGVKSLYDLTAAVQTQQAHQRALARRQRLPQHGGQLQPPTPVAVVSRRA